MSNDEDKSARLRAMRNVAHRMDASGGAGGSELQALLDRQKRAQAAQATKSDFYQQGGPASKKLRTAPEGQRQEGRPEPIILGNPAAPAATAAEEDDEDAAIRAMLPGGFGGVKPGAVRAAAERERVLATQGKGSARAMEGPARPPQPSANDDDATAQMSGPQRPLASKGGKDEPEDDEDEEEEEEDLGEDDDDFLPIANEVAMEGHKKVVSAMDLEHTGSRLITGSHDYGVKIYDFNGMKRDMRPFREIVPNDGYPVHALSWSPSGDQFLVVTGYPQPKIYDRDGRELGEFNKGDMYIRDLKNTKGHCSPCTSGQWHPIDKTSVLTAGADGSMRMWDMNYLGHVRGAQKSVIKPLLAKPGRVQVTSCCYSPDGGMVAGGVTDGSIQLFPASGPGSYRSASVGLVLPPSAQCHSDNHWNYASRPQQTIKGAHPPGDSVTSVAFARDGNILLSRCADGTLKVWDVRKPQRPLKTFEDLETTHEETKVGFSPNDSFFFTGVDAPRSCSDKGDGALVIFSKEKLEMVRKVGTPGNCVTVMWHHRLNQVFLGCGDHKSGATRVLYDDKRSTRGLLVCVGRKIRPKSNADFVSINMDNLSHTPHALPMFKEPMPGQAPNHGKVRPRKDPIATKIPQIPTPGVGGALGGTGGTLLTQLIMKDNGMIGDKNWRLQDPREAILRHAKDAEENPWRTQNAYAKTQPVPIWHESDDEEEED
eukprot:CAMPEP_0197584682 /NCGR_PEP_ID=MMETSP1326-20131121/7216_1 /TAXON_ID=1155430 /ORGANISM="Genus nov. species nov., Strain RCC2288" /LENGTH=710 /DNA_ID=CAMNT_0043149089 /DNA_START=43 /DNA_END=2175 /DNA_ORIENTATION=+